MQTYHPHRFDRTPQVLAIDGARLRADIALDGDIAPDMDELFDDLRGAVWTNRHVAEYARDCLIIRFASCSTRIRLLSRVRQAARLRRRRRDDGLHLRPRRDWRPREATPLGRAIFSYMDTRPSAKPCGFAAA